MNGEMIAAHSVHSLIRYLLLDDSHLGVRHALGWGFGSGTTIPFGALKPARQVALDGPISP